MRFHEARSVKAGNIKDGMTFIFSNISLDMVYLGLA